MNQELQQQQQYAPHPNLKMELERSWPQIMAVLPKEMNAQRLFAMFNTTISKTPQLAQCSVESVLSCFMQCTALGLEPSDVNGLGQAYILPYGNKNYSTGQKQATFILGYRGMLKLLEKNGIYAQAKAVYKDDGINLTLDQNGVPVINCPNGLNLDADHTDVNLSFVYFSVDLPNGGRYADYMTYKDLLAHRDKYAPRNRDGRMTGPWVNNFVEMCKKTIVRRSFKYLPVNAETQQALEADNSTPDYSQILKPILDVLPTAREERDKDDYGMEKVEFVNRIDRVLAGLQISDGNRLKTYSLLHGDEVTDPLVDIDESELAMWVEAGDDFLANRIQTLIRQAVNHNPNHEKPQSTPEEEQEK